MSRTGKIARLPQPLREELNHRLGAVRTRFLNLADWLNGLPEVTDLLAAHFEGRPISEQNLSDWRNGGLVEWQLHRELLAGAADCAQASADYAACGVSAKHFLAILNVHFASNLQAQDGGPCGRARQNLRLLKYLYATVLSLRRSEQLDERFALDRERLEWTREKQSSRPQSTSAPSPSASTPSTPRPTSPTSPSNLLRSAATSAPGTRPGSVHCLRFPQPLRSKPSRADPRAMHASSSILRTQTHTRKTRARLLFAHCRTAHRSPPHANPHVRGRPKRRRLDPRRTLARQRLRRVTPKRPVRKPRNLP